MSRLLNLLPIVAGFTLGLLLSAMCDVRAYNERRRGQIEALLYALDAADLRVALTVDDVEAFVGKVPRPWLVRAADRFGKKSKPKEGNAQVSGGVLR